MTNLRQFSFEDGPNLDAFGRLRVSNPTTIFDSKQLYDKAPLFWDEVTNGTGASAHSTANSATTISVAANADYVVRQTKMRFNYQPGKSQQIMMTFVLNAATTNVEKYLGYYNSSITSPYTASRDGIYLKQDGTTQYLCMAKSGSETAVAQASWNIDAFDGNGPSGVTLDWTKAQIMLLDFEWLGVGRIRIGFVVDGVVLYAHEFLNANSVSSVYMQSPNHSIRYEIRSTGGASSIVHICSSVASEGGKETNGTVLYTSTAGTHVDANTENTIYAVVGTALKSTHLDASVIMQSMAMQIQTDASYAEWILLLNPTVAGTFTYTGITNSAIERALGASTNTVTGGTQLAGGFLVSGGSKGGASTDIKIESALRHGSTIAGVTDKMVLCVRPVGGSTNIDIEGGLIWRELL